MKNLDKASFRELREMRLMLGIMADGLPPNRVSHKCLREVEAELTERRAETSKALKSS